MNPFPRYLVVGLMAITVSPGIEADPPRLDQIKNLVGVWRGVGNGKWGMSAAERRYEEVLDGHFVRARSQSVYPKQQKNPSGEVHRNIDMFSFDKRRNALVLRQFDNEGFATTYYVDPDLSNDNQIVFVAEAFENVPPGWKARLTYEFVSVNEYRERFELDTGEGYTEYLRNRYLRLDYADEP